MAVDAMRLKLEGHEYIEDYVRALTHELKSPLAAIRGAGELLQDDFPKTRAASFRGRYWPSPAACRRWWTACSS
jgi:two-component system sensor histidine kinase CreC